MGNSRILGIEGGGTKTTWVVVDENDTVLDSGVAGPGNTGLLNDKQLLTLFRGISRQLKVAPDRIGAAMAGAMDAPEHRRVHGALEIAFPRVKHIVVREDTWSALFAAHPDGDGIIVIAGTGSNALGRYRGRDLKSGGWGHLPGDLGSAYDVARRSFFSLFEQYDATGRPAALAPVLLRATGTVNLEGLAGWITTHAVNKTEIAALARCVFDAARAGCRLSRRVLDEAPAALAARTALVPRRLKFERPPVGLIGGLFEKEASYRRRFEQHLRRHFTPSRVFVIETPGAVGAARMARTVDPR